MLRFSTSNPRTQKSAHYLHTPLQGAIPLLPYQVAWIRDDSRLKIANKGRQIGFSTAAVVRAVLQCVQNRRRTRIFLSKGERQSRLLGQKAQDVVKVLEVAAGFNREILSSDVEKFQLEIRFPATESVLYFLPANPDTARGYTGDVTLDEFAFHERGEEIYKALYPTITRGYQIEIISTPNGCQGKYYELSKAAGLVPGEEKDPYSPWSAHRLDIYQAVSQGFSDSLPVNLKEPVNPKIEDEVKGGFVGRGLKNITPRMIHFTSLLRQGMDLEMWQQEYEGLFLSDAQNYIPMELILDAESDQATEDVDLVEKFGSPQPELYMGVDIGRKQDLTVIWLCELLGDTLWTRGVWCLGKAATGKTHPLAEQEALVDSIITKYNVHRCCIDQSGIGIQLAENMEKKHGAICEGVQFTQQVKESLAPRMKKMFEERLLRIPPNNPHIRSDIHSLKKTVTLAGNVRFDAPRTEKGHADRAWALALVCHAAEGSAYHPLSEGALAVVKGTIDTSQFPPHTPQDYGNLWGIKVSSKIL